MIADYLFQQWTEEKNCWWLVRHYYKNQLNIELPLYCVSVPDFRQRVPLILDSLKKDWQPIPENVINCLVAMGRKSEITHVGICISENKILHMLEGHSGKVEDLSTLRKSFKTINFYKYAGANL